MQVSGLSRDPGLQNECDVPSALAPRLSNGYRRARCSMLRVPSYPPKPHTLLLTTGREKSTEGRRNPVRRTFTSACSGEEKATNAVGGRNPARRSFTSACSGEEKATKAVQPVCLSAGRACVHNACHATISIVVLSHMVLLSVLSPGKRHRYGRPRRLNGLFGCEIVFVFSQEKEKKNNLRVFLSFVFF
jgi:hypothetical protein